MTKGDLTLNKIVKLNVATKEVELLGIDHGSALQMMVTVQSSEPCCQYYYVADLIHKKDPIMKLSHIDVRNH